MTSFSRHATRLGHKQCGISEVSFSTRLLSFFYYQACSARSRRRLGMTIMAVSFCDTQTLPVLKASSANEHRVAYTLPQLQSGLSTRAPLMRPIAVPMAGMLPRVDLHIVVVRKVSWKFMQIVQRSCLVLAHAYMFDRADCEDHVKNYVKCAAPSVSILAHNKFVMRHIPIGSSVSRGYTAPPPIMQPLASAASLAGSASTCHRRAAAMVVGVDHQAINSALLNQQS